MTADLLIELLDQQRIELEKKDEEWLKRYASKPASTEAFFSLTFYLICKILSADDREKLASGEILQAIKSFLAERDVRPDESTQWNPLGQFTRAWYQWKQWKMEGPTDGKIPYNFVPEHALFLTGGKEESRVWQIGFLKKEFKQVSRRYFSQLHPSDIPGRTNEQVKPMTPLQELASELLWEPLEQIDDIEKLIEDKRQLIFYGPPGTGKTHVARELAKVIAGGREPTLVQFHASYAYEDFFEGYRPIKKNGEAPSFDIVHGPLRRAAQDAIDSPDRKVVLIIDEINRANLPRVFGELFFALEYRDQEVILQYSDIPFRLPGNLIILGTMNTADRGIAQIDAALRRRFHFFPLFPDKPPIQWLLDRYLRRELGGGHTLQWLPGVLDIANRELSNRGLGDATIGPSYFMGRNLDEAGVARIWSYSIIPLLEERFPGEPGIIRKFELATLRSIAAQTSSERS